MIKLEDICELFINPGFDENEPKLNAEILKIDLIQGFDELENIVANSSTTIDILAGSYLSKHKDMNDIPPNIMESLVKSFMSGASGFSDFVVEQIDKARNVCTKTTITEGKFDAYRDYIAPAVHELGDFLKAISGSILLPDSKDWEPVTHDFMGTVHTNLEKLDDTVKTAIADKMGEGALFSYGKDDNGNIDKSVIVVNLDLHMTQNGALVDKYGFTLDGKLMEFPNELTGDKVKNELTNYVSILNEIGKNINPDFVPFSKNDIKMLQDTIIMNSYSHTDRKDLSNTEVERQAAIDKYSKTLQMIYGVDVADSAKLYDAIEKSITEKVDVGPIVQEFDKNWKDWDSIKNTDVPTDKRLDGFRSYVLNQLADGISKISDKLEIAIHTDDPKKDEKIDEARQEYHSLISSVFSVYNEKEAPLEVVRTIKGTLEDLLKDGIASEETVKSIENFTDDYAKSIDSESVDKSADKKNSNEIELSQKSDTLDPRDSAIRTARASQNNKSIIWNETGNDKVDKYIQKRNSMVENSSHLFPIYRKSPVYTFNEMKAVFAARSERVPINGKIPSIQDCVYAFDQFRNTNVPDYLACLLLYKILDVVDGVLHGKIDKVESDNHVDIKRNISTEDEKAARQELLFERLGFNVIKNVRQVDEIMKKEVKTEQDARQLTDIGRPFKITVKEIVSELGVDKGIPAVSSIVRNVLKECLSDQRFSKSAILRVWELAKDFNRLEIDGEYYNISYGDFFQDDKDSTDSTKKDESTVNPEDENKAKKEFAVDRLKSVVENTVQKVEGTIEKENKSEKDIRILTTPGRMFEIGIGTVLSAFGMDDGIKTVSSIVKGTLEEIISEKKASVGAVLRVWEMANAYNQMEADGKQYRISYGDLFENVDPDKRPVSKEDELKAKQEFALDRFKTAIERTALQVDESDKKEKKTEADARWLTNIGRAFEAGAKDVVSAFGTDKGTNIVASVVKDKLKEILAEGKVSAGSIVRVWELAKYSSKMEVEGKKCSVSYGDLFENIDPDKRPVSQEDETKAKQDFVEDVAINRFKNSVERTIQRVDETIKSNYDLNEKRINKLGYSFVKGINDMILSFGADRGISLISSIAKSVLSDALSKKTYSKESVAKSWEVIKNFNGLDIDGKQYIISYGDLFEKETNDGTDGQNPNDGTDGQDSNDGTDGQKPNDGTDGPNPNDETDGQNSNDGTDGQDSNDGTDGQNPNNETDDQNPNDGTDGQKPNDGTDGPNPNDETDGQNPNDGTDGQKPNDGTDGPNPNDGTDGNPNDGADVPNPNDGTDGQNSNDGADGQNPNDGADEQNPNDGADGNPNDGADGPNPNDGTDGQNPNDGADGPNPNDGADGQNPNDGTDGQNPNDGADEQNPNDGADGNPNDGADGPNPNDGTDGQNPNDGADGPNPNDGTDGQNPNDGADEQNPNDEADGQKSNDGADGPNPNDGADEPETNKISSVNLCSEEVALKKILVDKLNGFVSNDDSEGGEIKNKIIQATIAADDDVKNAVADIRKIADSKNISNSIARIVGVIAGERGGEVTEEIKSICKGLESISHTDAGSVKIRDLMNGVLDFAKTVYDELTHPKMGIVSPETLMVMNLMDSFSNYIEGNSFIADVRMDIKAMKDYVGEKIDFLVGCAAKAYSNILDKFSDQMESQGVINKVRNIGINILSVIGISPKDFENTLDRTDSVEFKTNQNGGLEKIFINKPNSKTEDFIESALEAGNTNANKTSDEIKEESSLKEEGSSILKDMVADSLANDEKLENKDEESSEKTPTNEVSNQDEEVGEKTAVSIEPNQDEEVGEKTAVNEVTNQDEDVSENNALSAETNQDEDMGEKSVVKEEVHTEQQTGENSGSEPNNGQINAGDLGESSATSSSEDVSSEKVNVSAENTTISAEIGNESAIVSILEDAISQYLNDPLYDFDDFLHSTVSIDDQESPVSDAINDGLISSNDVSEAITNLIESHVDDFDSDGNHVQPMADFVHNISDYIGSEVIENVTPSNEDAAEAWGDVMDCMASGYEDTPFYFTNDEIQSMGEEIGEELTNTLNEEVQLGDEIESCRDRFFEEDVRPQDPISYDEHAIEYYESPDEIANNIESSLNNINDNVANENLSDINNNVTNENPNDINDNVTNENPSDINNVTNENPNNSNDNFANDDDFSNGID